MKIAIMCSGGDAAGMNPALKAFVDGAYKHEVTPYFVYDGLEGLVDGAIRQATHEDVAGIIHEGGTKIGSSRSKRFFDPTFRAQAYGHLERLGIGSIIVLGGDGSFRAMQQFCTEFPIGCIGIPTTIDNDIGKTEYCLGVDTALNVIRDALDHIRDTASSFKRAFVVEVMGRNCGYLAAVSALTSGAEICLIPEHPFDETKVISRMKKEIQEGRRYLLAIVSEGTKKSSYLQALIENEIHMESRLTVLGHIQRGGSPTVHDRLMAYHFVTCALTHLVNKPTDQKIVVWEQGVCRVCTIDEVVSSPYMIPSSVLKEIRDE